MNTKSFIPKFDGLKLLNTVLTSRFSICNNVYWIKSSKFCTHLRYRTSYFEQNDHKAFSTNYRPINMAKYNIPSSIITNDDGEVIDLNVKQLCKESHQNLLLYAYNNFDIVTVTRITNLVLALYQTVSGRKSEAVRRIYLNRFLKCIKKHKPESDHEQLAKWFIRCIDILTCNDFYSMLRVRYILSYDNSFETFKTSFGMEDFEKFSTVQNSKEPHNKIISESMMTSSSRRRYIAMQYLKINRFKFLKEQNITKAVCEANIDWDYENIENIEIDESRYAFLYNLPFVELGDLKKSIFSVVSRFGVIKNVEIMSDRLPPLSVLVKKDSLKNKIPPPKDKYSPLYAIIEFENKEGRDALCYEDIRVFGFLCCGRLVYPEKAERKHSLLIALYPPFKRETDALRFIANSLVDKIDDSIEQNSELPFSTQCTIKSHFGKRNLDNPFVITASSQITDDSKAQILDNYVDCSMLDTIKKKRNSTREMDPQWIVLRFGKFQDAYFARKKLIDKLSNKPKSFVSFDTKRSIFSDDRYIDLELGQYNQRSNLSATVSNIARGSDN